MTHRLQWMWVGLRWMTWALLVIVAGATARPATVDPEVDRLLTAELNRLLATMPRIEGQQARLSGTARLDVSQCLVRVNLSRGFVPRYNGGEFEDQLNQLQVLMAHFAGKLGCEGTATFTFGGLDLDHYFPEDAVSQRSAVQGKTALKEPRLLRSRQGPVRR